MMGGQWRPILAALANDRVREAFARLTLGATADEALADLSPSRRRHVRDTLLSAGLVVADGETLRPDGGAFARALAAASGPPKPTGIDRFLSADGRILGYPAQQRERRELLKLVAQRVLAPDEVLTEREMNQRLETFSDDVAVLRRYLVDHELVERTPAGTQYALVVR